MNINQLFKDVLLTLIIFILATPLASAQSKNFTLKGEANADAVRLVWMVKSWPEELEGFYVQRRSIPDNSDWEKLHEEMIFPELSPSKSLASVESASSEQERLKSKLASFIDEGRAGEILQKQYIEDMLSNPNKLRNLGLAFRFDFDVALLNGFGFVDRTLVNGKSFEYGLFLQQAGEISKTPVATFQAAHGSTPDVSLAAEATVKSEGRGKVLAIWAVDTDEYSQKNFRGFNIYRKEDGGREYHRLNDKLIWLSTAKNPEYLTYHDQGLDEEKVYHYAAEPITIFGTKGERLEVKYEPKRLKAFNIPDLKNIKGSSEQGLLFQWNFEQEHERFIKGFLVERKASTTSEYTPVSGLLKPETRNFHDQKIPASGYYFYRLKALKRDGEEVAGPDLMIYYYQQLIPQQPKNLKAEWLDENGRGIVRLVWEKPSDRVTGGFYIYANHPPGEKLARETEIPLISENFYEYPVNDYLRGNWKFAVSAVSKSGDEGKLSDTVTVLVPSKSIPPVNKWNIEVQNGRARLNWQYTSEVADLKGFRIYRDGELMADEQELKRDTRNWVSPALEPGKRYLFEIMAVSSFGLESKKTFDAIMIQ